MAQYESSKSFNLPLYLLLWLGGPSVGTLHMTAVHAAVHILPYVLYIKLHQPSGKHHCSSSSSQLCPWQLFIGSSSGQLGSGSPLTEFLPDFTVLSFSLFPSTICGLGGVPQSAGFRPGKHPDFFIAFNWATALILEWARGSLFQRPGQSRWWGSQMIQ